MQDGRVRSWVMLGVTLGLLSAVAPSAASAQDVDQAALLTKIRDLMVAAGETHFVMPAPGSRSVILAIDTSTPLYFFMERGSIRGSAIDIFYQLYNDGKMEDAFREFRSASIPTIRVTDYGWNGLGVPMVTDTGTEVSDILYRDVEGVFRRAPEIAKQDVANYVSYLEIVIGGLQDGDD